ncbi:MAG: hypothetical protein IPM69_11930 [Ignavibacteria bacterium]|nr:hypothetical protein [Ignavibacteria bacterium]
MDSIFNMYLVATILFAITIVIYIYLKPKKVVEKFDSGEIRKIYYLHKGIRVGIENIYYRDKKINKTKSYSNGNIDGIVTTYYPSGMKYIEANYKEGKLSGEYKIYEEDGLIKEIKKY